MNFISIGGWCGPKIALKTLGLFNEPSLPFDNVRTSIEGVIDCIGSDFKNFFPEEIKKDARFSNWAGFVGEHVGFYDPTHNLFDPKVIASFERRFLRFGEKVRKGRCVFVRAVVRENCEGEIVHYKELQDVIDTKYPGLSYIICFIVGHQDVAGYHRHLDKRTFLFTVTTLEATSQDYKVVFDFVMNQNLFDSVPDSTIDTPMVANPDFWLVDGHPMVNSV